MGFPGLDVLGVGYWKPPPGSGNMVVLPNFGILPEFGDMCPGSVACPFLHTETSAGSVPRQFLTSAAGDTSLSDSGLAFYFSTVGHPFYLGRYARSAFVRAG